MISGRINTSAVNIFYLFKVSIFSLISSRRKLLFKRKQSSLNNKMFSCTCCVTFGITDCKTIKGSLYYYNYIFVGYPCDWEVTEHYFQTGDHKHKRIKAEILKTYKEYL